MQQSGATASAIQTNSNNSVPRFPLPKQEPILQGCRGESLPPTAAQYSSWRSTALLHSSVHCTALLQGSVCCMASSTCLGSSTNPDFQQLTCQNSLLHANFSKRMSQPCSHPRTEEKKQQWEPVINVKMVTVRARGWNKPVPSTVLQLDPSWMVTGRDTVGITSCIGLLSPERQSSPDWGTQTGMAPVWSHTALCPPSGAATGPALPPLPVICPRRNLHFIL